MMIISPTQRRVTSGDIVFRHGLAQTINPPLHFATQSRTVNPIGLKDLKMSKINPPVRCVSSQYTTRPWHKSRGNPGLEGQNLVVEEERRWCLENLGISWRLIPSPWWQRSQRSQRSQRCGFIPYVYHGLVRAVFNTNGIIILVGGFNPSEKYESQLGWLFPIYGKMFQTTNQYCIYVAFMNVCSGTQTWVEHAPLIDDVPIWGIC